MGDLILAKCYEKLTKGFLTRVHETWLGELYQLQDQAGTGSVHRLVIEPGIEIAIFKNCTYARLNQAERTYSQNLITVTSILSGQAKMRFKPNGEWIVVHKDILLFYDWTDAVDYYDFSCEALTGISVYLNMDLLREHANVTMSDLVKNEWEELLHWMFHDGKRVHLAESSSIYRTLTRQLMHNHKEGMTTYLSLTAKVFEFLSHTIKKNENVHGTYLQYPSYKKIQKIKEKIEQDSGEALHVNQLAEEFGISTIEMQQGFKKLYGLTVYRYIQLERMKNAAQLLKQTRYTITEIANEIGYDNPSKFTSAFKKVMLETPSNYRRKFHH